MRRRLFTIFSALSLMLCVAVLVLWVRSYWVMDIRGHATPLPFGIFDQSIRSSRGRVGVGRVHWFYTGPTAAQGWAADGMSGRPPGFYRAWAGPYALARWETLGFHYYAESANHRPSDPRNGMQYARTVSRIEAHVPHWFIALLLAAPSAFWVLARNRARRADARKGHCPSCGYDLRATPERCPECGHLPTPKPAEDRV